MVDGGEVEGLKVEVDELEAHLLGHAPHEVGLVDEAPHGEDAGHRLTRPLALEEHVVHGGEVHPVAFDQHPSKRRETLHPLTGKVGRIADVGERLGCLRGSELQARHRLRGRHQTGHRLGAATVAVALLPVAAGSGPPTKLGGPGPGAGAGTGAAGLARLGIEGARRGRWRSTGGAGSGAVGGGGAGVGSWRRRLALGLSGGGVVEAGQAGFYLVVESDHGDELAAHGGAESVESQDVGGISDGHHRSPELASDRDDVVPAGHGHRKQSRRVGIDVVLVEVDVLQVVIAREEPTGFRIAHACTIGTKRAHIERRNWPLAAVECRSVRSARWYRGRPHGSGAPVATSSLVAGRAGPRQGCAPRPRRFTATTAVLTLRGPVGAPAVNFAGAAVVLLPGVAMSRPEVSVVARPRRPCHRFLRQRGGLPCAPPLVGGEAPVLLPWLPHGADRTRQHPARAPDRPRRTVPALPLPDPGALSVGRAGHRRLVRRCRLGPRSPLGGGRLLRGRRRPWSPSSLSRSTLSLRRCRWQPSGPPSASSSWWQRRQPTVVVAPRRRGPGAIVSRRVLLLAGLQGSRRPDRRRTVPPWIPTLLPVGAVLGWLGAYAGVGVRGPPLPC